MNFQTMDYFVAVAEEKSFTKAAELLSVTRQILPLQKKNLALSCWNAPSRCL